MKIPGLGSRSIVDLIEVDNSFNGDGYIRIGDGDDWISIHISQVETLFIHLKDAIYRYNQRREDEED